MTKTDFWLYILLAIAIIGVVVLSVMNKSVDVLLPIMTGLFGLVVGKNSSALGRMFGKK